MSDDKIYKIIASYIAICKLNIYKSVLRHAYSELRHTVLKNLKLTERRGVIGLAVAYYYTARRGRIILEGSRVCKGLLVKSSLYCEVIVGGEGSAFNRLNVAYIGCVILVCRIIGNILLIGSNVRKIVGKEEL